MKNKTTIKWKLFIAMLVIAVAVSTATAFCDGVSVTCADYCQNTANSGECAGASTYNIICNNIGCDSSCEFYNEGTGPCGTSGDKASVCVGPNGKMDYVISESSEVYYTKFNEPVTCPNSNPPNILFSKVMPISIPLHFTFGIIDTGAKTPTAALNCGDTLNGTKIVCDTPSSTDDYFKHRATKYTYNWEYEYDAVVVAYDEKEPVPMLIGKNLTILGTSVFGDKLWYTEDPIFSLLGTFG